MIIKTEYSINQPTLGSLFDGSGGFPLSGFLAGFIPLWASEVEPYPIAVTRSRFPDMMHLGSVTLIDGGKIAPVDAITFGSPCQDLSRAGKQAGLMDGKRSHLFFEAIRIIKEMRKATGGKYPKYAVWENVMGALTSNAGEDFCAVLQSLAEIAQSGVSIPLPKKGKWKRAGCIMGDGFSIAWRTYDAQFYGVAQRRKRIYLVASFDSECAGELLFKQESLSGYANPCQSQGQAIASSSGCGAECPDSKGNPVQFARSAGFKANQGAGAYSVGFQEECACTLNANHGGLEPSVCYQVYDARGNGEGIVAPTLTGDHNNRITDYTSVVVEPVTYPGVGITSLANGSNPCPGDPCHSLTCDSRNYLVYSVGNGQPNQISMDQVSNTLDCMHDAQSVLIPYGVDCRNFTESKELYQTLQAKPNGGQSLNFSGAVRIDWAVRRLVPLECCRLQGFPDGWAEIDRKESMEEGEYHFWHQVRTTHDEINGKEAKRYSKKQILNWYNKLHSDSAEYKMWGNGIALPCAYDVMRRIAEAMR